MPTPIVSGDLGVGYVQNSSGAVANFPMVVGSVRTFINGRSVMLLGQALTAGGPISVGAPFTSKTFIEGLPVYLAGAVTNLATGWSGGVLTPLGALNTQMV